MVLTSRAGLELGWKVTMSLRLQLEYWKEGKWYVGRLPQVPGVFSQGVTIEEMEVNVLEAYRAMREDQAVIPGEPKVQRKEIEVLV